MKSLYKTCNAHWYQDLFQYKIPVKSPRTDFSSKICSKPLDRGEGARIYIQTGLEEKQGTGRLTVSQRGVKILKISGHLQIQWGQCGWVCVSECVCWCHSMCESMRDGSVPLCCTSAGFSSFQVAFVALDGLLDAQQEGRVPLVQARDRIKLFNLGERNRA